MMAECVAYRDQILRSCGPPPNRARLAVRWLAHESGTRAEVVCYRDERDANAVGYITRVLQGAPRRWDEHARRDLDDMGAASPGGPPLSLSHAALLEQAQARLGRIDCLTQRTRNDAMTFSQRRLSHEAVEDYCRDRLTFVRRVIASVDAPEFHELWTALAAEPDDEAILGRLGLKPSERATWLLHAHTVQRNAASCLYALAQHFVIPALWPDELEAVGLMLLSYCLQRLEREIDGAYILESFLELSFEDYQADDLPQLFTTRLARVNVRQRRTFQVTLARALQALGRNEDAARVMACQPQGNEQSS
jgi:hypothetical protein